jgi:hypothetical protein
LKEKLVHREVRVDIDLHNVKVGFGEGRKDILYSESKPY